MVTRHTTPYEQISRFVVFELRYTDMKISDSRELGELIKARRKELGYTQMYLSDASGLSVSFLSDLENGKKTIELEKTLLVINLLGMDIEITRR